MAVASSSEDAAHTARSWSPLDMFVSSDNITVKYALVVLNQPLESSQQCFPHLWGNATVRVLVDGAVNRVYADDNGKKHLPHIICGDFDSADEHILTLYRDKGVPIYHTEDQDYTDFDKSLKVLQQYTAEHPDSKVDRVYVVGAFGGRLDHQLANLNVLYTVGGGTSPALTAPVYLVDDVNMTWLLRAGSHEISVTSGREADWCGLVPVGNVCDSVTTSGLHWDLKCDRMEFGGLISTSNRLAVPAPSVVFVHTSHPVLWCMGIKLSE